MKIIQKSLLFAPPNREALIAQRGKCGGLTRAIARANENFSFVRTNGIEYLRQLGPYIKIKDFCCEL
jgi:hypothetical protein